MRVFRSTIATALLLVLCACNTSGTSDSSSSSSGSSSGSPDAGGSSSGTPDAGPPPFPSVPVDDLQVLPAAGSAFLVSAIGAATTRVELATYILTDNDIENALVSAHNRGVAVRVLLDGDQSINGSARTFLTGRGVAVRNGPAVFQNFHQKSVVVDGQSAWVMTLNPSFSAFNDNREYAVRITRAAELADLDTLFNADWDGMSNPVVPGNLVVSPNNARSRINALLGRATTDIILCVETFADEAVRTALKARLDQGMTVRIVMADPADVTQNAQDAQELLNRGFSVRFLRNPTMHAKLIVVDSTAAYVGSVNLTRTSMDANREVGVLIDDAARVTQLRTQAEADWNAAVAP